MNVCVWIFSFLFISLYYAHYMYDDESEAQKAHTREAKTATIIIMKLIEFLTVTEQVLAI